MQQSYNNVIEYKIVCDRRTARSSSILWNAKCRILYIVLFLERLLCSKRL